MKGFERLNEIRCFEGSYKEDLCALVEILSKLIWICLRIKRVLCISEYLGCVN